MRIIFMFIFQLFGGQVVVGFNIFSLRAKILI